MPLPEPCFRLPSHESAECLHLIPFGMHLSESCPPTSEWKHCREHARSLKQHLKNKKCQKCRNTSVSCISRLQRVPIVALANKYEQSRRIDLLFICLISLGHALPHGGKVTRGESYIGAGMLAAPRATFYCSVSRSSCHALKVAKSLRKKDT